MTSETLSLSLAALPVLGTVAYVGIRWAIRPIERKLDIHVAADNEIQTHMKHSLDRLETKTDRLIEHLLDR